MKLNIPKTVYIECPSCDYSGHSTDINDITICCNCGLQLHKDELININKTKIEKKIEQDLMKELFKNFK